LSPTASTKPTANVWFGICSPFIDIGSLGSEQDQSKAVAILFLVVGWAIESASRTASQLGRLEPEVLAGTVIDIVVTVGDLPPPGYRISRTATGQPFSLLHSKKRLSH
jgi:hypothetical protein